MRLNKLPRVRGAIRKSIDGYNFDSTKEANRYQELKLMNRAGLISVIKVHPEYKITANGVHICIYEGDFEYIEMDNLVTVCEDVKGYRTDTYKLKIKLARALYPQIKFREVL